MLYYKPEFSLGIEVHGYHKSDYWLILSFIVLPISIPHTIDFKQWFI